MLVLHAHLPYVRYPGHSHHLEERWLFEAITETYLPLLDTFEQLLNDRIDFRLTLSLTPTLVEMLRDRLLMERYQRYLAGLMELSGKEIRRTRGDGRFHELARMYGKRCSVAQRLFQDVYRKDLVAAFAALARTGKVELITSAATHAFLPAISAVPSAARAQVLLGARHHQATFGRKARGMWLPECGYVPELEPVLREAGMRFFFLEDHGLMRGSPRPRYGIYLPVKTPLGIFAFARDTASSRQVWSASEGYPGDFDYRDFYRDIGFDLDLAYLRPHLPEGVRTFTGLKYFRITGATPSKKPYIPEKALRKARIHAGDFTRKRVAQIQGLADMLKIRPVVTAAYDAELFGHWWHEGPAWLNYFFRAAAAKGQKTFTLTTPSEYLAEGGPSEPASLSMSSWGNRGYSATWVDETNGWIYRHLARASRLMTAVASERKRRGGLIKRGLCQAGRELLLAQSSDWAFMMNTDHASAFARNKFIKHLGNFLELHRQISAGAINGEYLAQLEAENNLFADLDFRIFADPMKP